MNKKIYLLSLIVINVFIKFYLIFYFSENLNLLFKSDSSNYLDILQFLQNDFINYFSTPLHSHRSLGYPFFLFLLSKLYNNLVFFIFVQALISLYTLFITYKICNLIIKNSKKILFFLIFINFSFILYSVLILTEAIFIPIFYTFIYFFIKYMLNKKNIFFLISIIFLAVSSLIRPTTFYLFFIICVYYFLISELKIKNFAISLLSISILLIFNYPILKKNLTLYHSLDQSTISTTMILDYWLPSIERYKYSLSYSDALNKTRTDFNNYLIDQNFDNYENPFKIQKQARKFFFIRISDNEPFNILKGFLEGPVKSILSPVYVSYTYWLNISYTGFHNTVGNSFISQNINYFFNNSNFLHGIFAFVFLIFTIILRLLGIYGFYKLYKLNKNIFFFFIFLGIYFLILNGSAGSPRHRLPLEFILIIVTSLSISDMLKYYNKS